MKTRFSKIHGIGNDFIVINELEGEIVKDKPAFAIQYCSRHFSVGADGILFLQKSEKADFRMKIINSDGSEAETCVNGLRCVAFQKFVLDNHAKKSYLIETLAGIVKAEIIEASEKKAVVEISFNAEPEIAEKNFVEIASKKLEYYFVDVGNPHAVFFIKEKVKNFDVENIGHAVEYHEKFMPARTNAEFVNVVQKNFLEMRVHERGACETLACGSGSIATAFAAISAGNAGKGEWIRVKQPGGTLEIMFGKKVVLRGETEKAFEGELDVV
jgi:diaminopimelate epimerase